MVVLVDACDRADRAGEEFAQPTRFGHDRAHRIQVKGRMQPLVLSHGAWMRGVGQLIDVRVPELRQCLEDVPTVHVQHGCLARLGCA